MYHLIFCSPHFVKCDKIRYGFDAYHPLFSQLLTINCVQTADILKKDTLNSLNKCLDFFRTCKVVKIILLLCF